MANIEVNQILEATLSPDAATRKAGEEKLNQAAQENFGLYLQILSQELANDKASVSIRQAAGLALKNSFSFRDVERLRQVQQRWSTQLSDDVKGQVKEAALHTLNSPSFQTRTSAAQVIASIAAIELPHQQWPKLMEILVQNVGSGSDDLKQASLTTIGFICESDDVELRDSLVLHSNAILTAVVQGARKEEGNNEVRNAALSALSDATEFIRTNFDNEGERNYIMQVICEATQSDDTRVQAGAFGCLNRVMGIYYDKMRFYMEKALFGLTIAGMKNEEEDVAKLAIEFWCTVCEEEISIEDDNQQAQQEGSTELRPYFQFARVAAREVVPVLLQLLTKVELDDADEEYNVARAAYQCLQLYAQTIGGEVVPAVVAFVEANLRAEDWHKRDAAVSSFGAIMDGPDIKTLDPLVKQALPVLISMMSDPILQVQDSSAYALSRICDCCSDCIDPDTHLQPLMSALFHGLMNTPKMASSCCLALMNLTERFIGDDGTASNPLTPHFQDSVTSLLAVTEKQGADNQLRTAAYEVLGSFVTNAAIDSLQIVADLSNIIIQRLEATLPMQKQVVSIDDKITLEELQTSLAAVLLAIVQRLEQNIGPQADRVMQINLEILTATPNTAVPEVVFQIVSALTNALATDFLKYMESFLPFLQSALSNQESAEMCSLAVGLVSDIVRALEDKAQPWCDTFMNHLLNNLRSDKISNQLKPPILETFGDIASSIGAPFETYLTVVAQVLQQAATVSIANDVSFDMIDYIISLRSGIVDAWSGVILAFKGTDKVNVLQPYIEPIFSLLHSVSQDMNHNEGLLRSCMGVIGDLSEAFPNGEISNFYRNEWLNKLIKEARTSREFSTRTIAAARWAREQAKRQVATQHQDEEFPSSGPTLSDEYDDNREEPHFERWKRRIPDDSPSRQGFRLFPPHLRDLHSQQEFNDPRSRCFLSHRHVPSAIPTISEDLPNYLRPSATTVANTPMHSPEPYVASVIEDSRATSHQPPSHILLCRQNAMIGASGRCDPPQFRDIAQPLFFGQPMPDWEHINPEDVLECENGRTVSLNYPSLF